MKLANLISIYWLGTLVVGILAYLVFNRAEYTFYDIVRYNSTYENSIIAHCLAVAGLMIGAAITPLGGRFVPITRIMRRVVDNANSGIILILAIALTVAAVTADISAYGIDGLLRRSYYLPQLSTAVIIGQLSAALGIFFGAILAASRTRRISLLGYGICAILIILSFSKGSRFAAFSLILAVFLPQFVRAGDAFSFRKILLCIVTFFAIVPLMHIMLYFRYESSYGFLSYFSNIGNALGSILDSNFQPLWEIVLNLTFSLPVVEVTIAKGPHLLQDILTSLSPLPGELAGWYDINEYRRITEIIPFSAMGELYGYSPILLFVYMILVGAVLTRCERYVAEASPSSRPTLAAVLCMAGVLFALLAPQYNLRNATRGVYYCAALFLGLAYFRSLSERTHFAGSTTSRPAEILSANVPVVRLELRKPAAEKKAQVDTMVASKEGQAGGEEAAP